FVADRFVARGARIGKPLASHYAVPAIHFVHEYATAGGLMSYGGDLTETYRQAGIHTGRILKCSRPRLSLSLTSRPPRCLASQFHRACSPSLTRSSNEAPRVHIAAR